MEVVFLLINVMALIWASKKATWNSNLFWGILIGIVLYGIMVGVENLWNSQREKITQVIEKFEQSI